MPLTELIESLAIFFLLVFSSRYRMTWVSQYKRASAFKRFQKVLELVISMVVALGVISITILAVAGTVTLSAEVDKCLDSGGSYNYEACACDSSAGHLIVEDNKCKWQVIGL